MGEEAAVALLLGLIDRAAAWGVIVAKARAEGRDITGLELSAFAEADDLARASLVAAIAKRRESP
jgi:hypothetical protein